jgi:nucleoside-diphosphate-sugar epimerase
MKPSKYIIERIPAVTSGLKLFNREFNSKTVGETKFVTHVYDQNSDLDLESSHPYGREKALSECYLNRHSNVPVTIVRPCGIYSDYCELPPITWLINRWHKMPIIPSKGLTEMPYLHVSDFNRFMECVISKSDLPHGQVLYASNGLETTSHNYLFNMIMAYKKVDPIYLSTSLIKAGYLAQLMASKLGLVKPPSEKYWMFNLIDIKMTVNNSETNKLLDWHAKRYLYDDLKYIMANYRSDRDWNFKQQCRENGNFSYH